MSKKNLKVHLSSKSDEWSTPNNVYKVLDDIYGPFEFDMAATAENTKCPQYSSDMFVTSLKYGNVGSMFSKIWCNPPYSELKEFLKIGYEQSQLGATIVMLIPSRTCTKGWHQYVMKASEVLFVQGRIKFGGNKNSAPFPSAIVVFKPGNNTPTFKSIKFT
jgi:site-specific DNA-methyltransferase (adenine-specific)